MISITLDPRPLIAGLTDLQHNQLPYGLALGLNRTAEEVQQAIKDRILQRGFHIRSANSARFLTNQIKFYRPDRASKTKLEATIRLDPSTTKQARSSLLTFLEKGGIRTSRVVVPGASLGATVAVPDRANLGQNIPRAMFPAKLGLRPQAKLDWVGVRHTEIQGRHHTYVAGKGTRTYVFQRTGDKPRDSRLLFSLKPSVSVPGREFFDSTATRVGSQRIALNCAAFVAHAIATGRRG